MADQLTLFDVLPGGKPREETAVRPKRTALGWTVVDHACLNCGGRVLVRLHKGREIEARCAECGSQAEGDHSAVCCCGADLGELGKVLECFRNPNVSKEVPYQILVRERVTTPAEREARASKPVRLRDW